MVLQCAAWTAAEGDDPDAIQLVQTKAKGFIERLLGRGGPKPRRAPSAADASTVAGAPLSSEDDVLHMRHLPDFGGALKASDVEVMLQTLLAPYLRIPLLLNFFADPSRTSALSCPELQHMLDAALFEPGEWQPNIPKALPKTIPAPSRDHLKTPAGLLFNELTHAAAAPIVAVCAILENALDLDAGRYVRVGSSATILYAVRLAIRLEGYVRLQHGSSPAPHRLTGTRTHNNWQVRFLLATEASTTTRVRGLSFPGAADFGGDSPTKQLLRRGADSLRVKLVDIALPVLLAWYVRLRRDSETRDACAVAAHIAHIYADTFGAAAATPIDAKLAFVLLSTRVFLNVNHDYEVEPEMLLEGNKSSNRKRAIAATANATTSNGELGFSPLLVFDLWQRHLVPLLAWLRTSPREGSEVMEAIVRLLSGSKSESESSIALDTRDWSTMVGCGCVGRFAPAVKVKVGAAANWGLGGEDEAPPGTYAGWLRAQLAPTVDTEINVQLGELTLKRHHMQLLDSSVVKHSDFVAVFGVTGAAARHRCADVKRSEHRRWVRLLSTRHDVQVWGPDDRAPPAAGSFGAALVATLTSPWVGPALEPLKA